MKETKKNRAVCGNCISCMQTYLGCCCILSDNAVEYDQEGCIDHIPEDPEYDEN